MIIPVLLGGLYSKLPKVELELLELLPLVLVVVGRTEVVL